MMDLESAIQHCEEVAESKRKQVENGDWEKGSLTERDCIECAAEHRQLAEWLKELKAYREQSGDAISRDKVIVQLSHLLSDWDDDWNVGIRKCIETVKSVESVTPQQRTGRWIKTRLDDEPDKICDDCGIYCWKCSICGNDASGWGEHKYCPKCGAKMEVE